MATYISACWWEHHCRAEQTLPVPTGPRRRPVPHGTPIRKSKTNANGRCFLSALYERPKRGKDIVTAISVLWSILTTLSVIFCSRESMNHCRLRRLTIRSLLRLKSHTWPKSFWTFARNGQKLPWNRSVSLHQSTRLKMPCITNKYLKKESLIKKIEMSIIMLKCRCRSCKHWKMLKTLDQKMRDAW